MTQNMRNVEENTTEGKVQFSFGKKRKKEELKPENMFCRNQG